MKVKSLPTRLPLPRRSERRRALPQRRTRPPLACRSPYLVSLRPMMTGRARPRIWRLQTSNAKGGLLGTNWSSSRPIPNLIPVRVPLPRPMC